jgi:hypothetical protein
MSRNLRLASLVLLALVAVLALWVGLPRRPKPQPPQAPAPMSFSQTTPDAKVELTLAPDIARRPDLRARLYQDGVKDLTQFAAAAHDDRAHVLAKGFPVPSYERTIAWTLAGSTPLLLSARGAWFEFTGGAHPNHGSIALLWNPASGQETPLTELFRPDALQGPLDRALCRAIRNTKAAHEGAIFDPAEWPCPHWADSRFVLVPSTTPGRIGGLDFLFDPYAIGPYVEGDYQVIVPQEAFHEALAPAWADQFAGAPDPAFARAALGG